MEAKYDREAARAELERFGEAQPHPEPPEEFANLAQLADYHRRVQEYETAIERLEVAVEEAELAYKHAAHFLREVMSKNVPLHYDYPGRQEGVVGNRYLIVKRGDDIVVTVKGEG